MAHLAFSQELLYWVLELNAALLFILVIFHLFNLNLPVIHGNFLSFGNLLQMPSAA